MENHNKVLMLMLEPLKQVFSILEIQSANTLVYDQGQDIYIRLASSELDHKKNKRNLKLVGTLAGVIAFIIGLSILVLVTSAFRNKLGYIKKLFHRKHKTEKEDGDLATIFDFSTITNATNNFSDRNELGEGGFGTVYKGIMVDGQEIAVKRLSKTSGQGTEEFKNEVKLMATLQHRNLVKLLGCSIQQDEKLLIYEFMPNRSLDCFIFDTMQSKLLNWTKRLEIIDGIARGLLSFLGDQAEANTNRVMGTYGYMPPEYAVHGYFSIKSDVFSFGVVLLEIISGRKNRGFCDPIHHLNLLGHAWRLWIEERPHELIADISYDADISSELDHRRNKWSFNNKKLAGALGGIILFVMILGLATFTYKKRKKLAKPGMLKIFHRKCKREKEDVQLSTIFGFSTISKATNHFSDGNKIGQGGFGPVYKGVLEDGLEIAVKRLSENSEQGEEEFKNEVMLMAKLQHQAWIISFLIQRERKS
ncbi:unnamed protein product [Vicia faba]|uniref:non-specific serine/threonine protein kinase n=1 Tax=Vicia faba TaxID=3906 RepID=A0AAV0ZCX5_VICFA|nr:unnamed protein product [Vicia faba]